MRTRIKICGITRPEDGVAAAELGADAIGLVFHAPSRRAVAPEQAARIVAALPPFVCVVALFLDPDRPTVERVLETLPVDLLQFHGQESAGFCTGFGRRYLKSVGMAGGDAEAVAAAHPRAAALLLDGHAPGAAGGSGERFDWSRALPTDRRLVVAGGLTPDNVAEAVDRLRPWGVDVSSGVESAPGIKDHRRIATFIEEVQRVQRD
ncbi:phosphoribosylanthranilate isomerase [Sediminicurvatus halobius]|uniref:N-(5'-phosphoribosyl)anthranilate isomerase n=1 Tax=Sediminicurvatus halobius TaxID=2182432 RepID=A0A2U2MWE1_9GAMM|nr:phosphoribosylanthranilate isomerase [Spiribacter halobius]PWG61164.1 phosphoribosylanthranilate isomerase [Spiribacter halobius]UEX78984.1 phosphoribosylanthranilate isomerase [Spiribacter halobius]